jgi:uncharacterized damage-inducible protein DinB
MPITEKDQFIQNWERQESKEVERERSDMRTADVLWTGVMDTVHHRGQFSVYLRMAGGKVPSIYGPSADEPWM